MKITEAAFQQTVIELAKWHRWLVFHPLPAQNTRGRWRTAQAGDTGFPDLVLAHPQKGVIFAELKSTLGRISDRQQTWIDTLRAAGAEAYVWRPTDLELIKAILKENKP